MDEDGEGEAVGWWVVWGLGPGRGEVDGLGVEELEEGFDGWEGGGRVGEVEGDDGSGLGEEVGLGGLAIIRLFAHHV